jgi:hypothetical protein
MTKRELHRELDQALAVQREQPGRAPMVRFFINPDYYADDDFPEEHLLHIDHHWGSPVVELHLLTEIDESHPLLQFMPAEIVNDTMRKVLVRLDVPVSELVALCKLVAESLPERDHSAITG